jgi:hypothetical protein
MIVVHWGSRYSYGTVCIDEHVCTNDSMLKQACTSRHDNNAICKHFSHSTSHVFFVNLYERMRIDSDCVYVMALDAATAGKYEYR